MASQKPLHYDVHGRLQILAIDDDQINLMVIESVLFPFGWNIVPARDSDEAYAAVRNGDCWPDLVLLDYNLEIGDTGEQVLAELRRVFGATKVPIVMCTAMSANSAELDRCLANGAADVLLKPYERTRVAEIVNKHCPGKATPRATAPAASLPMAAAAAPTPAPPAPSPSAADVESFCVGLGLDYVGKKLKEQGVTLVSLKAADDAALRKLGVVVKAQRDKLLDAAQAL